MERIGLAGVRHAERRRWRSGGEWDEGAPKVAVGQLGDGALVCADLRRLWALAGPGRCVRIPGRKS